MYPPTYSSEFACTSFVYKVAEVCVWLVHTSESPRLCWLQAVLMAVKPAWIRLETCGEFARISPTWTIQALISITQSIRQSTDNNEFGSGIFIDLKRVSDSVNDTMLWTWKSHLNEPCFLTGIDYGILPWIQLLFTSLYYSSLQQLFTTNKS